MFEVGSAIWAVSPSCQVVFANVTNPKISRFGTIEAALLGEVQSYGYLPKDCFPTLAEAHAEARKRARELLNRVELAAAESCPEDTSQEYRVFDKDGYVNFICYNPGTSRWHYDGILLHAHTPADAIRAVIGEVKNG